MIITLTGKQAEITFDLLRRYRAVHDLGKGEISTETDDTSVEWDGDEVKLKMPDAPVIQ